MGYPEGCWGRGRLKKKGGGRRWREKRRGRDHVGTGGGGEVWVGRKNGELGGKVGKRRIGKEKGRGGGARKRERKAGRVRKG